MKFHAYYSTRICKSNISIFMYCLFVYLRIYLCIFSVPFMQTCVKRAGHFCSSNFEILRIHAPVVDMFLNMKMWKPAKKASLNVVFIEQLQNAYKNQLITLKDGGGVSSFLWLLVRSYRYRFFDNILQKRHLAYLSRIYSNSLERRQRVFRFFRL